MKKKWCGDTLKIMSPIFFHIVTMICHGTFVKISSDKPLFHISPENCDLVVQQVITDWHLVVFLILCKYLSDPLGTNFVILQHCQICFQCIRAGIQLHTQIPSCNLSIHADEYFFLPGCLLAVIRNKAKKMKIYWQTSSSSTAIYPTSYLWYGPTY